MKINIKIDDFKANDIEELILLIRLLDDEQQIIALKKIYNFLFFELNSDNEIILSYS